MNKVFCPECDAPFANRSRMEVHKLYDHPAPVHTTRSLYDQWGYMPGYAIEEPWDDN